MANASDASKDIPGFGSALELPPELQQDPDIMAFINKAVTQWSRIAAWTWCDYLAFKNAPNGKTKDEQDLKEFLQDSFA